MAKRPLNLKEKQKIFYKEALKQFNVNKNGARKLKNYIGLCSLLDSFMICSGPFETLPNKVKLKYSNDHGFETPITSKQEDAISNKIWRALEKIDAGAVYFKTNRHRLAFIRSELKKLKGKK
jgi:hypothetical protein